MKKRSLFYWMANNIALAFLLGVELVCLLYGIILVLPFEQKDDKKPMARIHKNVQEPVIDEILIVAEDGLTELVNSEMEIYSLSNPSRYKVVTSSRESAIELFSKNENTILILSGPMDEKEISGSKIQPQRLPLKQEVIDNSLVKVAHSPIFVKDNTSSLGENSVATFLENDVSQDLVYQKMKNKPIRNTTRKG